MFGIGIVIGWFNNDEAGIHRVHDIGFGIAYGVLAAAAFFALVARGGRLPSIALQVAAVALGVIAGAAASADLGYAVLALGLLIALGVLLAISPNRRVLVSTRVDLSPVLAAFVLVAAVPLVCAGLTWARYQRDGFPLDPHVAQSHWATMAAMAFALLLACALAAARLPGWRFTAWCVGVGFVAYGIASVVFARFPATQSSYPGSEGVGWGIVAIVGGVVFVALAELISRDTRFGAATSGPSTVRKAG